MRRCHLAAILLTGELVFVPLCLAQTHSGSEQVIITGTRIRQQRNESPAPIVELSAEEIQRFGYTNLTDALADLSQNTGGFIDQQQTLGFTPSASAIDLRGFGVGRSLVLLDGRRLPVFPIGDNGTDNFVDLSSIPLAAIRNVQVLTDGASAIYGSDAISGVVNIELKKNVTQSVAARFARASGGGANTRVQVSTGFQKEAAGKLLVFLDYQHQNVLRYSDRAFSRSDRLGGVDGRGPGTFSSIGNPGTLLGTSTDAVIPAPDCSAADGSPGILGGFCRFNRAAFRELVPDFWHASITAQYEKELSPELALFSRVIYLNSRTTSQAEPMPFDQFGETGTIVAAAAPNNPTNPAVDPSGVFAGLNDDIVFLRRLVEYGPRTTTDRNQAGNALLGLRGTVGRMDWEVGVQYAEQRVKTRNTGFARKDALARLLAGPAPDENGVGAGTLNLFLPIPESVVGATGVVPTGLGKSAITTVDAALTGDLIDNWAGTIAVAGVLEHARQSYSDARDPETLAGNVVTFGGTSGGGGRDYNAVGIELQIPLLRNLNLNLAGRYDHYDDLSDVGGAFSPRAAIQYRPLKNVLLRASAGKSFRAPDLQRLFGGTTVSFADVVDTPKCIQDGGTGRGDPNVQSCTQVAQSIQTSIESNLRLKEERGENYSAGVVWNVLPDLTLSLDAFYIRLRDIVNTPTTQFILDRNAEDGSFSDAIARNPLAATPANPGGLENIALAARNLSFQRTTGFDLGGEYLFESPVGDWNGKLGFTYLQNLEAREEPGQPVINGLAQGTFGEFVRFRGFGSVGWSRGPWAATALINHIGPFTPLTPDFVDRVGSWTTVNLSASYDVPWNGRAQIGANNVFDRDPPLALGAGDASQPFFDQFFHNPYGALVYLSYVQSF